MKWNIKFIEIKYFRCEHMKWNELCTEITFTEGILSSRKLNLDYDN